MRRLLINLRLFWQGAALGYVALFSWMNPMLYLASKILMPMAQMFFFVYLGAYASGGSNASFYIVGNAIQVAAISGIFGVTMSIGGERNSGTLAYLFGSPANRLVIFSGRAFMNVLDGALNVVMAFGWAVLLMGLDLSHANLGGLALVILVTTISTCGLGLMLGSLALITVNVMLVNNLVYFLLLLFSGANVPLERLPGWMQAISSGLPLTRGIAAGRILVAGGSLESVSSLLVGELLVGLVYSLLGYFLFSAFEMAAKQRGTLEAI